MSAFLARAREAINVWAEEHVRQAAAIGLLVVVITTSIVAAIFGSASKEAMMIAAITGVNLGAITCIVLFRSVLASQGSNFRIFWEEFVSKALLIIVLGHFLWFLWATYLFTHASLNVQFVTIPAIVMLAMTSMHLPLFCVGCIIVALVSPEDTLTLRLRRYWHNH